jgi:tetratricopeptide (TPR) repeat protein
MAKRLQPKVKSERPAKRVASPSDSGSDRPPALVRESPASASRNSGPLRRSTYVDAVSLYERGLAALQRHDYNEALGIMQSVLRIYPEEKELHERVRLYLNICERHAVPQAAPQTVEERLYASTLALNGGRYDEAIAQLRLVRDEDPDNDYALYMLAVAHAQRDEPAEAIAHLERAIALNPENRALARRDPDLEPLHADDAFREALAGLSTHASDRDPLAPRRTIRPRPGR